MKFNFLSGWFTKSKLTVPETTKSADGFTSLSPIDDAADENGKYTSALLWALQNRHINRNIAITGPYGSGKSSLIKTFEKNNTDPELVFLNISLATFEDLKNPTPEQEENMLRLIELSILQQMFYHEEDHDIPDSRFKKTQSFPKRKVWQLTGFIFVFLLSSLLQLYPKSIQLIFWQWEYPDWVAVSLHYASLVVVLVSGFFLILKSIRPLRGIQLKKFNFQDAEFGIDEKISKSILNEHLDEILYFFEVTNYTVVVIEDLDRFNQPKIFTKLRELNQLINYSKKTKRFIAFVYAVKDDMFNDKERAKFFDFILPVVPVINSANSESKLTRLSEELECEISGELIDNISLFVDDMRLMHNILNEYLIYRSKVKPRDADKLFAMIVYKNIYPKDFVKLSQGTGDLFTALGKKSEFVRQTEDELQDVIIGLKEQINRIEDVRITDIEDLRKVYVWNYVAAAARLAAFEYNGRHYDIDEMLSDDMFEKLRTNSRQVKYILYGQTYTQHKEVVAISKSFEQVEKEVDEYHTYKERLDLITSWQKDKHEDLKAELQKAEERINRLRRAPIKELMSDDTISVSLQNKRQNQIVNIMLRNGYIDENYYDYISVFHEGSLSKSDQDFLLNVRAHVNTPFEHPLTKLDKLILKLGHIEFEGQYVYNFHLMDHLLLNTNSYSVELSATMKNLSDEKNRSVSFISGYIDHGVEVPSFINNLSKAWPGFWQFVNSSKSAFTPERVGIYFKLIIEHSDVPDIAKMDGGSIMSKYISDRSDFLKLIPDAEKLQKIIKALKIKFNKLDLESVPESMVDFVCNGNFYVLRANVIEALLTAKGSFDRVYFEEKNYTFLHEHAPKAMVTYIEEDIREYVNEVLLERESGGHEAEPHLLRLLNHEGLELNDKQLIIEQSQNKISDLINVHDRDVKALLLKFGKSKLVWENVLNYFDYEVEQKSEGDEDAVQEPMRNTQIDAHLEEFLNNHSNAKVLAALKIDTSSPRYPQETYQAFVKSLLLLNNLDDDIYRLYLDKSVPYHYNGDFGIAKLSGEKAQMLITHRTVRLSVTNYNALRNKFVGLHIILVEHDATAFLQKIDEYEIDAYDLEEFLASNVLTLYQKNVIVDAVDESTISESVELCKILAGLLLAHSNFTLSKSLVRSILENDIGVTLRVKVLNLMFDHFSKPDIMEILATFPEPYKSIAKNGKMPLLEFSSANEQLADALVASRCVSKRVYEKKGIRISTFRK